MNHDETDGPVVKSVLSVRVGEAKLMISNVNTCMTPIGD